MTANRFPQKIFVTGSDTDVGKTVAAGIFAHCWQAHYWKPIQSGVEPTTDTRTISEWIGPEKVLPEGRILQRPMSPNQSAELEQTRVELRELTTLPDVEGPLVVEGAGGLGKREIVIHVARWRQCCCANARRVWIEIGGCDTGDQCLQCFDEGAFIDRPPHFAQSIAPILKR